MAQFRFRSLWPKRWLRAFAGVALATGLCGTVVAADPPYFAPPDPSHLNRELEDPEKVGQPREAQPVKAQPVKAADPVNVDPPKVEPMPRKEVKKEPTYTFEFRDAPWSKIIEWFTGISGLAYSSNEKPPTGSFQFIPPKVDGKVKQYTIAEIIDILNVPLYQKGFILTRRDESFTLLPVDDKVDPSSVPHVTTEELKSRGNRELVQIIVGVKSINATDLALELKPIMSKFHQITPLERSGQIVLIDQVSHIRRVLKIIEEITDESSENYTKVCKFVKARAAEEHLIKLMGDPKLLLGQAVQQASRDPNRPPPPPAPKVRPFSFASDDRLNAVYVNGPSDIITKAKRILDDFDKGTQPVPPGEPFMKTYEVEAGSADAMVKALEVPFKPSSTLRAWALGTNKVMVWAGPQDQADIAKFIEGQKTDKAEVIKRIPISVVDAAKLATLIKSSYLDPKGAPFVTEDEGNNIFVRGTAEQVKQVEAIIRAMDGPTANGSGGTGPSRAVITIKEGGAANVGGALEKLLREMGHNPKLIRPGFDEPELPDLKKDPNKDKTAPKDNKPKAAFPSSDADRFVAHHNGEQLADPRDPKKQITITAVGNKIFLEGDDPVLVGKAAEMVRLMLEKGGEGDFTVLRLKKANATEVARIIDAWFNPPARGGGGQQNPLAALLGGGGGPGGGMQFSIGGGGPGGGRGGPGGGGAPGGAAPATEQTRVRIVADPSTNALLVRASFVDLMTIKEMLAKVLDKDADESDALVKTHIIKLYHASATEVVSIVREVFREYTNQASSQSSGQSSNPFAMFGMQQGRQQPLDASGRPKPVQLSLSYDDRTNSIVVACPTKIYTEVSTLVKQLDDAAKDASRTVKVVSVKGIDPLLVQQAVDAIQGRRPQQQQGGRGGFGQGGFGGGGLGGSQFGGGFGQGGFGQGGINPGFGQGQGGFGPGGFRPGGFGQGGFGQGGFGQGGGFGGGQQGGGGRTRGGGGRSPDDGDGGTGPSFFESRDMDVPSRSNFYDPQRDPKVVQAQYAEPVVGPRIQNPNAFPAPMLSDPRFVVQEPPKIEPKDLKKDEPKETRKDGPLRESEEIRGLRSTVNIEALEELGIVVISANTPADLEEILKIIAYLQKLGADAEQTIYIMPLEHGDATSIVNTMNQVLPRINIGNPSGTIAQPLVGGQIGGGQLGGQQGQPVVASSGTVTLLPLARFNSILIGAPRGRMADVINEIKKFDKPTSPQSQLNHFPLSKASAQIVASQVQQLYNQRYTGETLIQNQVRVTADVRTNTVIVQAGPADLEEIRGLIERIDNSVTSSVNELRVIRLRNALADELSNVLLQALISGVATQTAGTGTQTGGLGGQLGGGQLGGGQLGGGQLGGGQLGGGQFGGGQLGGQLGGGQLGQTGRRGFGINTTKTTALRFLGADGKLQPIESGYLEDTNLTADVRTNSIIVSAPTKTMELIQALINELDRPSAARAQINVWTLKRADAVLTGNLLQQLFGGSTTTGQQGGGQQGGGFGQQGGGFGQQGGLGGGGTQTTTRPLLSLTGQPSEGANLITVRISVDDRTNSILVAATPGDLETIGALISRLEDSEIRPHINEVIKLRNAAAADVVTALQGFYTSALGVVTSSNLGTGFQNFRQTVVLAAEPVTNTVLVSASAEWFPRVLQMIERLDMQPPQVSVQCLIAEVRLTNTEEFGVEIGLQSPIVFNRGLIGTGSNTVSYTNSGTAPSLVPIGTTYTATPGVVAAPGLDFLSNPLAGLPGFNLVSPKSVAMQGLNSLGVGRTSSTGVSGFVFSGQSDTVNVLVRALKVQSRIDILNTSNIQTLDNQTGYVNVGQSFPYVEGGQFTTFGTFQPSVAYRDDVGVTLRVTPRISPEGRVLMRVEPSVVSPVDSQINLGTGFSATAFNTQVIQTTIMADDGETVVIGGLISKQNTRSENKLPFLGDLPYIGTLFRYRQQTQEKRELIVILTPRIIRCSADAERVSLERMKLMNWNLKDVAKVYGPDPLIHGPAATEGGPATPIVAPHDPHLPPPVVVPGAGANGSDSGVKPVGNQTPTNMSTAPVQEGPKVKEPRGWSLFGRNGSR